MANNKMEQMTDEQREMVTENYNLIYHVLKTFPYDKEKYEDYEQIGALALCKAAINFDPSKGNKFSTFAIPYIRLSIITYYRTYEISSIRLSSKKYKDIIDKKEEKVKISSYEGMIENEFLKDPVGTAMSGTIIDKNNDSADEEILGEIFVEQILDTLNEKERELFEYLLNGYNQTEIAAIYNCTRANINIQVQKIRAKLKEVLKDFYNEEDESSDELDLDDENIYEKI